MKGYIIHQHGLKVGTKNQNSYYSNYIFYEKETVINLEKDIIYDFYCSKCKKYSLNYDNHDNFNYYYMVNPLNSSSYIKFQNNFNIGYVLLGNEIERENYIYIHFNEEIEKLKNYNSKLIHENSLLKQKHNLLEKENSRLSNEIKTLNNNNDKNEKIFQNKINILNDKIEKKKRSNKRFRIKI